MVGAPRGDVKSGGVAGFIEEGVSLLPDGVDRNTEVQQATHSGQVVDSGKAAQQHSAFAQEGVDEGRMRGQQGTGVYKVGGRAGGDKPVERLIKTHVKAATLEQLKDVFAAMMSGHLQSMPASPVVAKERICAMVKKHFDGAEGVIAKDGMLQRGDLPGGLVIGIGTMLKGEQHAFLVVPVGFADEQSGERTLVEAAGLKQDPEYCIDTAFCHMVGRLFVVGISPVRQEQLRHTGVPGDGGSTIDGGLGNFARRRVDGVPPAGIGICSCFKQDPGCRSERLGAGRVETKIARKAEVGQSIPAVGTAFGCCERTIVREEALHNGGVAETAAA